MRSVARLIDFDTTVLQTTLVKDPDPWPTEMSIFYDG